MLNKEEIEYIKSESCCLALIYKLYDFIIKEVQKDEYNDKVKKSKKIY